MSENNHDNQACVTITADVVAAYVSNNPVQSATLADLIANIHTAFSGLANPSMSKPTQKPIPAFAMEIVT